MTAAEIAETLTNGNISDAREAILYNDIGLHRVGSDAAVLALDVLDELAAFMYAEHATSHVWSDAYARLRRCLTGGT